jgi:hypothetical protein
MRRTLCTMSLAALLASGGALAAQSKSEPQAKKESKLTGCLKEAADSSAAEATSAKKFVLDVMPPPGELQPSSGNPEPTRAQTPDRIAAGEKETYALMAMGGVDLSKHVNHLVELTGTKEKMGERSMFHVTALRMVSTRCTQTSR